MANPDAQAEAGAIHNQEKALQQLEDGRGNMTPHERQIEERKANEQLQKLVMEVRASKDPNFERDVVKADHQLAQDGYYSQLEIVDGNVKVFPEKLEAKATIAARKLSDDPDAQEILRRNELEKLTGVKLVTTKEDKAALEAAQVFPEYSFRDARHILERSLLTKGNLTTAEQETLTKAYAQKKLIAQNSF